MSDLKKRQQERIAALVKEKTSKPAAPKPDEKKKTKPAPAKRKKLSDKKKRGKALVDKVETPPRKGSKLAHEHQSFICSCLASGANPAVTAAMVEDQYGIKITRQNIAKTYLHNPYWVSRIRRMRTLFDKKVIQHPLMSKQARLNVILTGINEALTWRLDKIVYDKSKKESIRIMKRNLSSLGSLVNTARVEAEGEKASLELHANMVNIELPAVASEEAFKDPDGCVAPTA